MHELIDGIDVHRHWTYITSNEGFLKKTLGHISYLPSSILLTNRHLQPLDVAIGTSPTFFAAMAAAYTAARRRIPFIMEVRDLWPAIFVELGVLKNPQMIRALEQVELGLYRRATRIVTVTEAFRQNLIDRGVPAAKVHTITNGADVDYWTPIESPPDLRQRLGLEGKFVVLYIGAHGISQALGRILESAAQLSAYPHIQFLFVGEGAEKAELIKTAAQQKLANIHFIDGVAKEQVNAFYALADVCLVPLRDIPLFDTFIPSKMFEIMAMRRPIIGSVRGEAASILERSGGALVVAPEDSQAIATAIRTLFEAPAKRHSLAACGRDFVVKNYSRAALAKNYVEVIQESIAAYRTGNHQ
jgi:glycosyltransferase involved in cell wall biosynthesis